LWAKISLSSLFFSDICHGTEHRPMQHINVNVHVIFPCQNYFATTIFSIFIHVAANDRILFFLWLNIIPLCSCYIFFIHSSINGLGGFHILVIMNSVSINISSTLSSIPLNIYLVVGLLNHMVVIVLVFKFVLGNHVFHHGCINLCSPQQYICYFFSFLHNTHWNEMIRHCGFEFPWWLVIPIFFIYTCWSSICPLWKMSIQVTCSFFNQFF
jgi:hypothetical protein